MRQQGLADLKVGDEAIAVSDPFYLNKDTRRVTVEKIGRRWITVSGGERYDRETGGGSSYGGQLFTEAALTEARERLALHQRASQLQWTERYVPLAALRAWVAALEEAKETKTE